MRSGRLIQVSVHETSGSGLGREGRRKGGTFCYQQSSISRPLLLSCTHCQTDPAQTLSGDGQGCNPRPGHPQKLHAKVQKSTSMARTAVQSGRMETMAPSSVRKADARAPALQSLGPAECRALCPTLLRSQLAPGSLQTGQGCRHQADDAPWS